MFRVASASVFVSDSVTADSDSTGGQYGRSSHHHSGREAL